jgi:hypothetical protein
LEESRLRGAREQRGVVAQKNWLLLKHSAEGTYQRRSTAKNDGDMAAFDFTLEVRVFEDEWTVIPLVDAQVITADWKIFQATLAGDPAVINGANPTQDEQDGAQSNYSQVSLTGETLLVIQELDEGVPKQVLATNKAGLYRINFTAYVFVHANRNLNSFSLNLLHPITFTKIRLAQESASKSVVRDLNIVPSAQCTVDEGEDFVSISVRLPPTKVVEVKWRGVDATEPDYVEVSTVGKDCADKSEPLQITASHDVLHSISDGVLQSSHTVKYTLDSEQTTLPCARIVVRGLVRVTSITGHGVLSWKATPGDSSEGCSEAVTRVEVSFKSSLIADTIIVLMNTEMELERDVVTLPTVMCEGVLRQTGTLGVVKIANVEVHEHEMKGLARIGIDELPEELRYQTNRPIMFAYKYLSPQFHVKLSVVKHDQVSVMEAVVENAFYEVLVVDTQSMHRLMLVMQNSNQQYLALRGLPADARIWSLMVNSVPAKPVRGSDGALLIPLLVGTASDGNQGVQKTSVEVAYLSQHTPLGGEGTLLVTPPKLDVPISTVLVEVQLPDGYDVEFTGSLQKVERFSYQLPQPVNNDRGTDMVQHGFNFSTMAQEVKSTGVNVRVPQSGQRFRFQRLLVVDGGAAMTVAYKTPPSTVVARGYLASVIAILACEHRRRQGASVP